MLEAPFQSPPPGDNRTAQERLKAVGCLSSIVLRLLTALAASSLVVLLTTSIGIGLRAIDLAADLGSSLISATIGLVVAVASARPIYHGTGWLVSSLGRTLQAPEVPGGVNQPARIAGPLLPIVRVAWWLIMAVTAVHYIIGFPRRFWQFADVEINRGFYSPELAQALDRLGVSRFAFGAFHGSLELLVGLTCVTVGLILFLRRPDHWAAFTSSLFLICYCSSEIALASALRTLPNNPFHWSLETLQPSMRLRRTTPQ